MSGKIVIKTSWVSSYVESELSDVTEELRNAGINVTVTHPDAHGILPELGICVAGGVSVYLISKLIDAVINKIVGAYSVKKGNVSIYIIHIDTNTRFRIPDSKEGALEYFRQKASSMHESPSNKQIQLTQKPRG